MHGSLSHNQNKLPATAYTYGGDYIDITIRLINNVSNRLNILRSVIEELARDFTLEIYLIMRLESFM